MHIRELALNTANLKKQLQFYRTVLELPVVHQRGMEVSIKAGNSLLSFKHKPGATPYHFAFNIPSNKAEEALAWLRERVSILGFDGRDLIDFPNWNALSLYFYDADKNIVEFIARKNLNIIEQKPFGPEQLLEISEVGIGTENLEKTYRRLDAISSLPVYWGDFDKFCAAGDEHGLFILSDRNKRQWFPTGDIIRPSAFILHGTYNIAFTGGEVLPL